MPVIAIVNRKGGSGKSTIATHLAAYCANAGLSVMLGDVDHQQSTHTWLRLRSANRGATRQPIVGWAVDPRRGLHAPAGTTHVVLDTPGGLSGFELARVVMFADVILMPVCNSVFDRESAAQCLAELRSLPRVASGRCKVAAVGMRVDARTRSAEVLRAWADALKLPFVGVLRDTQAYVHCIEAGLTLFDLPASQVQADLLQWSGILNWLAPVLRPQAEAAAAGPRPVRPPLPAAALRLRPPAAATAPRVAAEAAMSAAATSIVPVSASDGVTVARLAPSAPPVAWPQDGAAAGAATPSTPAARMPLEEPPVLTAVVRPALALRPRLPDLPARGVLPKPKPEPEPTAGWRLGGWLDLAPLFKRAQRST